MTRGFALRLFLALLAPCAATAGVAAAQEARWELTPAAVVIGEPIVARLVVEHPADARPDLAGVALDLDDGWVVLDEERAAAGLPGATRSERSWTVLSLEPGARAWPAKGVDLADGTTVTAAATSVDVAPELGSDEDAPRPLPGFHPVPERAGPLRPPHLLLGLLGGLAVAAGWWWTSRRGGLARRAEEEDELARLARLAPPDWDAPGAAREYAWGLATLLREAARRGLARDRRGLSEEELVAALRAEERAASPGAPKELDAEESDAEELDAEELDELEALFAECARIKFAGERPTRFALEALGRRAEAWLAARARRRAAPSAVSGAASAEAEA